MATPPSAFKSILKDVMKTSEKLDRNWEDDTETEPYKMNLFIMYSYTM